MNKRLLSCSSFSISTIVAYGYALGGLGSYAMGVPKPVAHRGGAFVRHGLRRRGAEALEELPRRARTREKSPRSGKKGKTKKSPAIRGRKSKRAGSAAGSRRAHETDAAGVKQARPRKTNGAGVERRHARHEFTKTTKRIRKKAAASGRRLFSFFVEPRNFRRLSAAAQN